MNFRDNIWNEPTHRHTDAQAETNMLPTFSKLGHKYNDFTLMRPCYAPLIRQGVIPKNDKLFSSENEHLVLD